MGIVTFSSVYNFYYCLLVTLLALRYEHASGRKAVLEMLHAIIVKFPKNVVDEQAHTLFVYLVLCLANDQDNEVRLMAGTAIKRLIGCIDHHSLIPILDSTISWYLGEEQQRWCAAAQVTFHRIAPYI